MRFQRKKVALALGMGGVALVAGGSVVAQDIRVQVTGTNIPRAQTETASPIETITREDIQASGLQTIQEVVRQITANNNGSISPSFTNGFSASGTAVSLRGLGPTNTLVLLNGRRLATFGLADDGHASYADLSQIPFDLVERIEVLKDGASAIYGADAVAGVVNVILRQNFTGVTATATGGVNYNGEGGNVKAAITGGVGDLTKDKYNAYLSFDYQKQKAVPSNTARDYMGSNDLRSEGWGDQRGGEATNPSRGSSNSLLGNVRSVNPTTGGSPLGYVGLPGPCAPENQAGQYCIWEPKDWTDLTPEIERFNVFGRAAYNFTPNVQGYAEFSYFQVNTETRNTPPAPRSQWYDVRIQDLVSSANIFLPVGHPDNPFSAQNRGARLYYTDAALGGRDGEYESRTQRYLVGLKGTTSGWDWDVAGLYINSETDVTRKNFYSYDRLQQGYAGTGPYGYYRIGSNASLNNPAIYDWIAPDRSYTSESEVTQFDIKASRDIYKMEGGQMALAVGYEFRREEINAPPTPGTDTANVVGLGYASAVGSRNVNGVYGELYIPILKNLEVTAALRWDDYSDINQSTWNPKVGVKWNVIPQLVARGSWSTSFRAPTLYESGNSSSAGFVTASDPIRCPVTNDPADCKAGVLSANSGNPNIKPETATTWGAGLIWEPVPGLSAAIDYWNIVNDDYISLGSVQAVLENPANFPLNTIRRGTDDLTGIPNSGSVLAVIGPWQNAAKVETDGIDLDLLWRHQTKDYGTFTTQFQWTHIFNFNQTLGSIEYKYAGTSGNYDVSSGSSTPENRWNLILGWNRGPWSITGTVRFVGEYDETPWQGQSMPDDCLWHLLPAPGTTNVQTSCTVDSFTTLDLAASYKGFKNWEIFGSIINVFNEKAPFAPAAAYGLVNYNYNYAFSGATGTQFNLGVRYTF